ncbi:hypothetical protein SAICODRAFT_28632 [Saitoella complicata NRRL Y-17804]|uniref:uncharacterized protein n=1 Tax=Saitoella complicata (strain BCRC 22490 / CBS 7301 / JCM 7358 / NBRC 10748 / NRRL Y-17804) TaxID=698492 RepID=UPI000867C7D5|nr:uncharacterized protein SAICODRAFT_28632 [Saitoella complicata NRRL Y-17804]ODQ56538.1 hypothetical protein SAICODRAFT_28632 [Saitoella complicata NRRL Y-17804]
MDETAVQNFLDEAMNQNGVRGVLLCDGEGLFIGSRGAAEREDVSAFSLVAQTELQGKDMVAVKHRDSTVLLKKGDNILLAVYKN